MTDELRAYFEESACKRLAEIEQLLPDITHDRDAFAIVARHFHAFAGLGGTYGYPRVSELGDEAEDVLAPLTRAGRLPDENVVALLRRIIDDIEGILPRPCGPPDAS